MTATAKALVQRLRQAREAVLRAEPALTFAQILFAAALIAAPVGLLLLTRRRRARSASAARGSPAGPGYDSVERTDAATESRSPSEYKG